MSRALPSPRGDPCSSRSCGYRTPHSRERSRSFGATTGEALALRTAVHFPQSQSADSTPSRHSTAASTGSSRESGVDARRRKESGAKVALVPFLCAHGGRLPPSPQRASPSGPRRGSQAIGKGEGARAPVNHLPAALSLSLPLEGREALVGALAEGDRSGPQAMWIHPCRL